MESYSSDSEVRGMSLTKYLCQNNYNNNRMALELEEIMDVKLVKGEALNKIAKSAPYNILENTLICEETGQRNSLIFSELLDESLGELESSIIFSKEVDLEWLMFNFSLTKNGDKSLSLVYEHKNENFSVAEKLILQEKFNIKIVNYYFPNGLKQNKHNTKLMILKYKDQSIRIVVPSGCFTKEAWDTRSMILWVSDRLPEIGPHDAGNGDSVTYFKKDLTRYLKSYNSKDLSSWIETVQKNDFKSVNVFFVATIPGDYDHDLIEDNPTGHPAVKSILTKYSAPIPGDCPIVAQSKVLSIFGRSQYNNFLTEAVLSFGQDSLKSDIKGTLKFNIIMTSLSNYEESYNHNMKVHYQKFIHSQQEWVNDYLFHWNGLTAERTKCLHSMKTYARWSEQKGIYWFMFGSQNLSRSGFGTYHWTNLPKTFRVTNFEVGVLFMPKIIIKKDCFPMFKDQEEDGHPIFPLPYKVPLTHYGSTDRPYFAEDKKY